MKNFDYDDEECLLDEIRHEDKNSLKSTLNKKKLSKWEMDEALLGEI
ncbi:hypothetical protein JW826_04910 [Candidatus Woesearchaeota archaeon]|nr:hypothetical protein [Candidatus Woesearchaeota archaeon]